QLAAYLQGRGVGPEVLVAISVNRTTEMLVALLGILKAGGAYLPLDPNYPKNRLAYMLKHSRTPIILTETSLLSQFPKYNGLQVLLDRDWDDIRKTLADLRETSFNPAQLAYVIYTSGSTGMPKGVEIPHAAVVNLLSSMKIVPGMTSSDRVLALTTLSFDISVTEIFLPLAVGARICLVDRQVATDALLLAKQLGRLNISYMQATPATWRMLLETGWKGDPSLRIISGGETLTRDLADKLLSCCGELWNLYGPTEATVWATAQRVQPGKGAIPIGIPIANREAWVLDESGTPLPPGQPGELYLGGAGLARGYLHDANQTAEKFITHPFSKDSSARLYRTGDRATLQEDGVITNLGRTDQQVKVRGFRIELGEIEQALEALSFVRQAVVITHAFGSDDVRLVAYLKTSTENGLEPGRLRAELGTALPDYMIPACYIAIENFPLTPSGKVNRKALPSPESAGSLAEQVYVPPSNELEAKVAQLTAMVLTIDRIGLNEDLFHYGADSLKLAQLAARLRDSFKVEIEQRSLFENPSVAGIAMLIDKAKLAPVPARFSSISKISRQGSLPLSFAQQRVWFLHQLYPESLAYNFQCTIRMRGTLDVSALEETLNAVTRRHEIYRTTYELLNEEPSQIIHEHRDWKLPVVDFSSQEEPAAAHSADLWYRKAFQERYDPKRLPMARWDLLKFAEEDHVLVHREHHLVHDGWSFNLFLKELFAHYAAFAAGKSCPLEPLPVQFADFAAWERKHMQGPDAEKQLSYWLEKLDGLPPLLELPDSKPRPKLPRFAGAAPRVELDTNLCQDLRQCGRKNQATLFMTMLTGFVVLLHRLSGSLDVPVGTVFANRKHSATENLIGMILNNVIIRARLVKNPTFTQLLKQVRTLVLEASSNQEVPFDQVVEAIDPPRHPACNPLFQIFFGFHDEPMPEAGPEDLEVTVTPVISNGSAKFDLGVIVIPHSAQQVGLQQGCEADGLTLVWEYSTDLFEASTIQTMIEAYKSVLQEMVSRADQPVSRSDQGIPIKEEATKSFSTLTLPKRPSRSTTAPRNTREAQLLEIWKSVLGYREIGIHDDLFDLGGHSLLATKLIVRIRDQLRYELTHRAIFEKGTIAAIAEHIENWK
ncbi:MAG: amino acid adenylation domain-containing protein, partial [Verrucomicrobiae bacterium]|nr:amino acid adenylation domain-containing protein [Verrucomicrobiae bacterium]